MFFSLSLSLSFLRARFISPALSLLFLFRFRYLFERFHFPDWFVKNLYKKILSQMFFFYYFFSISYVRREKTLPWTFSLPPSLHSNCFVCIFSPSSFLSLLLFLILTFSIFLYFFPLGLFFISWTSSSIPTRKTETKNKKKRKINLLETLQNSLLLHVDKEYCFSSWKKHFYILDFNFFSSSVTSRNNIFCALFSILPLSHFSLFSHDCHSCFCFNFVLSFLSSLLCTKFCCLILTTVNTLLYSLSLSLYSNKSLKIL